MDFNGPKRTVYSHRKSEYIVQGTGDGVKDSGRSPAARVLTGYRGWSWEGVVGKRRNGTDRGEWLRREGGGRRGRAASSSSFSLSLLTSYRVSGKSERIIRLNFAGRLGFFGKVAGPAELIARAHLG